MIRAHLATFPPRRRLLRGAVEAMLPQVDHLFVALNQYPQVPGFLRRCDKVTAVIPERDLKDAGKFLFPPAPGDIVFTIDDDIGYPPDYVARTLALAEALGWRGRAFGYQGHVLLPGAGGLRWRNFMFHQALDRATGVSLLGTGTLCARGWAIPPLAEVEPLAGACDVAVSGWLAGRGILPWALPREAGWLSNRLPRKLRASSLYHTVARARRPEHLAALRRFAYGWPHANLPFAEFRTPGPEQGRDSHGPVHTAEELASAGGQDLAEARGGDQPQDLPHLPLVAGRG